MQNYRPLNFISLSLIGLGAFFLPLIEVADYRLAVIVGSFTVLTVLISRKKTEALIVILLLFSLHAQWGVADFALQGDLNLRLLGETKLSVGKAGIAKFGADKTLRAYGPYMHSNSFGGVMVIALVMLVLLSLRPSVALLYKYLFSLYVLAVLVSFSRGALLSLVFLLLVMFVHKKVKEEDWRFVGLVMILFLVFTPFYIDRFRDSEDVGITERLSGYNWSLQIIKDNGLWKGLGFGNYKETLKMLLDENSVTYNAWQIDYVHSVPLLVVAVLGVLPTVMLSVIMLGLMYKYMSLFKFVLVLSIVPLLTFDHYLVTQVSPFAYLILLITI